MSRGQVGSVQAGNAVPSCRVAITGNATVTADSTIYVDNSDVLAGGFQLT